MKSVGQRADVGEHAGGGDGHCLWRDPLVSHLEVGSLRV